MAELKLKDVAKTYGGSVEVLKNIEAGNAEKRLAIADCHVPFGKLEDGHDLATLSLLAVVSLQVFTHEAAPLNRQSHILLVIMREEQGRRPLVPREFADGVDKPSAKPLAPM